MDQVRLMRGQVVIREAEVRASDVVWTPDADPQLVETHRGRVLAKGPPALTSKDVEVPHGLESSRGELDARVDRR